MQALSAAHTSTRIDTLILAYIYHSVGALEILAASLPLPSSEERIRVPRATDTLDSASISSFQGKLRTKARDGRK
ncbi:hypothetical protein GYMLUDRAFT_757072 [Collybiopsis luxurians FD-317 M1]|uniref:Uncharacterized protein n=1 Tax=Collybiopsis luxurians FD-317 M1 TaxID=944289 RepID=A0A0D0CPU7_9AGAR|nr:hypothetical protein GYMLUDRAFT_757072 [Collybiopsis luxurians FD-317 M1]